MADPQTDDLLEQLSHAIMGTLNQPAPTAPTAPNPVGLSPLNAAAAAMNPQFAPLLLQQANAPAQNQYAAQQAAFEAAMGQRNQALQAASNLAGRGITGQYGVAAKMPGVELGYDRLEQEKVRDAERERHNREMESLRGKMDETKVRLVYDPSGYAYWAPVPTVGGSAATATPVPLPGGGQAAKPLTEATVKTVTQLRTLRDKAIALRGQLTGPSGYAVRVPQVKRSAMRMARGIEGTITGAHDLSSRVDPEGEIVGAAASDLSDYLLRLRSGAQINENEYVRLSALLPSVGENPATMAGKLDRFFAELDSIERERSSMQAGVGAPSAAPNGVDPAILQRAREIRDKMKAGGR